MLLNVQFFVRQAMLRLFVKGCVEQYQLGFVRRRLKAQHFLLEKFLDVDGLNTLIVTLL